MKRITKIPKESQSKIDAFRESASYKINYELQARHISKREIARLTGLTYMTVLNITSGRSYSFESLIQVLDVLGMDLRIRRAEQ